MNKMSFNPCLEASSFEISTLKISLYIFWYLIMSCSGNCIFVSKEVLKQKRLESKLRNLLISFVLIQVLVPAACVFTTVFMISQLSAGTIQWLKKFETNLLLCH